MIISISGTHCTGKSTLVEAMMKSPTFEGATFLKSSGRKTMEENKKVRFNEEGDFFSQFYQMTEDCQTLMKAMDDPLVICDRCFIDTLIYSRYLCERGNLSYYQLDLLKKMGTTMEAIVKIDKVFLLRPTFSLQKEVNRSMSKDFQTDIYNLFDEECQKHSNWEYLPDTLENRLRTLSMYVKKAK